MRLRAKTLLLTIGSIIVLFVVLYGSAQLVVSQSFKQMERDFSHRDLSRLADVLKNDEFALRRQVSEWATWDDSYEFLAAADSSFIKKNLQSQTYLDLKIDVIAYLDNSGRIVFGAFYEKAAGSLTPLGDELRVQVDDNSFVFRRALKDTLTSGIILLSGKPLLLAAHAIVKKNQAGPARGVLVFGSYWDQEEIAQISEITHIVVNAYSLSGLPLPDDVYQAGTHLSKFCPWYFKNLNRETGAAYIQVADLYGAPALILRIILPRDLNQLFVSTTKLLFFIILGVTLTFAVAIVLLLEKHLISRVAHLISTVTGIAVARDLSARVPVQGKDELARLSNKINEMLAVIETSGQEQKGHAENLERLLNEVKINEGTLRNIFDFSPDGIAIADLAGTIINCNQAALDFCGSTDKSEMLGRSLMDLVAPKERAKVLEILRDLTKQGSVRNFETLFLKKNGTIFECEISLGIVKGSADQAACIVAIGRDVTRRKQAAKELFMSEQRYRLLFEKSLAGVYRTSLDGRILEMNDTLMHTLGFNCREEMLQCRVPDFYPETNERDKFLSILWEKGSIYNYQHELLRADGTTAWVLENASLVIGDKDEPLILQGTIIDISELKKAENELRESEARYRRLMDSNPAGIFRLAFDPRTLKLSRLDCNEAHARILGYSSREELLKVDLQTSLGVMPEVHKGLQSLLENRCLLHYESPLHKKDGSIVWVLANATYAEEEDGTGLIEGTLIDITAWRTARERLRAQEIQEIEESLRAAMGLMTAGLAHNLNGPLQGIMNSAEILQLMHGDLPHLDDILQQAQRLSTMINGILIKTRQEQDLGEQEIDLNRLLIQELDYYNVDLAFKHEVEKNFNFDSRLPTIRGVYCEFSQAFMNIIKNAVDAMHGREEKRLCVSTQAESDGGISIEISDTGAGIAPEHVSRIFDPFFTTKPLLGKQSNGEPTGTGLGLSSAKQLLDKYGVNIKVDSQLGQGTIFKIHIPPPQETSCETAPESWPARTLPQKSLN